MLEMTNTTPKLGLGAQVNIQGAQVNPQDA